MVIGESLLRKELHYHRMAASFSIILMMMVVIIFVAMGLLVRIFYSRTRVALSSFWLVKN